MRPQEAEKDFPLEISQVCYIQILRSNKHNSMLTTVDSGNSGEVHRANSRNFSVKGWREERSGVEFTLLHGKNQ